MDTIGVLVLPGSRLFDFAVVNEVWGVDRTASGIPAFTVRVCASGPVPLHPAGAAEPTHDLTGLDGCDLVVVLGREDPLAEVPPDAVTALGAVHRRGAGIAALCSGGVHPRRRRPARRAQRDHPLAVAGRFGAGRARRGGRA